jgi:hypothetical protein
MRGTTTASEAEVREKEGEDMGRSEREDEDVRRSWKREDEES